jgi:hypothetical protein
MIANDLLNESYTYMGWLAFAVCVSLAVISTANALYVVADTISDRWTMRKQKPKTTPTEQQQAIDDGGPL